MSTQVMKDVGALLRARTPLLWIVSREEPRVELMLSEVAAANSYQVRTWDIAQGTTAGLGQKGDKDKADPGVALDYIAENARNTNATRTVWIMRDLPAWLSGPAGAATMRAVRNLALSLPTVPRNNAQAIVILSPSGDVPPELSNHCTLIDWPLPDRAEIATVLDTAIKQLPEDMRAGAAPNGTLDQAIDAAVGLTSEEAQGCYAKSLVQTRTIVPQIVASEKKRIVAREKVLEWFDPIEGGLDAVGGLENLKSWLNVRRSAYSAKAREYGLPAPRGCVIVGVQGCGKSLSAKAVASAWGVPLLRMDLGALKSKYVGESEGNLRKGFRVIDAIGRCVVWLDEIEKAMQGATSGSADGGVSADALGAILAWMQERTGEAFVIATSNDVSALPPELLRKGRFDDIWFVDTPNLVERSQVLAAALRQYKRGGVKIDFDAVAKATHEFTGAEIAGLVPEALYAGFNDGAREITTEDILEAARNVVPLTRTAGTKIAALREWAKDKARRATTQSADAAGDGRLLDIA